MVYFRFHGYHTVTRDNLKTLTHLILACTLLFSALIAQAESFKLGITSATARGQYALLEEWRDYLQIKLDHPVEFVFRDSYLELLDLMKQKKLDFAWVSSPAYLENEQKMSLLVTPVYKGHPFDHAYLIVPATDQRTQSLFNLKNKVFAYVDPDSSTGYLDPKHQLKLAGKNPERFFKKAFFTRDEQKVVAAVAIGLADAGSMSGFAWDTLALSRPDITAQTRVVSKSAAYGFPPVIVRNTLSQTDSRKMQRVLLDMKNDVDGLKLLQRLNIEGFILADKKLYEGVQRMMIHMGDL